MERQSGKAGPDSNFSGEYQPMAYSNNAENVNKAEPAYSIKTYTRTPCREKTALFQKKENRVKKYRPMAGSEIVNDQSYSMSAIKYRGGGILFKFVKNIGEAFTKWYRGLYKILPWKK